MQTETTPRLTTLTPTEKILYDLLSKGERVSKTEMCRALGMDGDQYDIKCIYVHIFKLKQKVKNLGLNILVESWQRRSYYRMVRNLHSASE